MKRGWKIVWTLVIGLPIVAYDCPTGPRELITDGVDGYLVPVPTAKKDEYKRIAELGAGIFKECGALSVVECWGDDVPEGKVTSFPMAVKRKDDETVVFSWVTWPSKAVRDVGMKKFMEDPRMQPGASAMPFDGQRMIFGGFQVLVSA